MATACDLNYEEPGLFTMSVSEHDNNGVTTYNSIELMMKGQGLDSVSYQCFEYSWSKDMLNEELLWRLIGLSGSYIEDLNAGNPVYLYIPAEADTEYEVVVYVKASNGATEVLRKRVTTGEVPNETTYESIPFTEYRYGDWTFDNYSEEVIIINSDEELAEYVKSGTDSSYPEVDFSKYTLLLAHGGCVNGISDKKVMDLLVLSEEKYRMNVQITVTMTDCPERWTLAILSEKLNAQSTVDLYVEKVW